MPSRSRCRVCAAMADRAVHLVAREHQLDRPAEHARREDAQDLRPGEDRLRAEAAAEEGRADQHVLRRDAEKRREGRARHDQRLVRRVERQPVAVPRGDDRMRLHRVVVLRRRLVARRRCAWRPRPARPRRRRATTPGGMPIADRLRHEALADVEADARRLRLVARREQRGAFGRRLQRLGDDERDRLVGVADAVVLQHLDAEREDVASSRPDRAPAAAGWPA